MELVVACPETLEHPRWACYFKPCCGPCNVVPGHPDFWTGHPDSLESTRDTLDGKAHSEMLCSSRSSVFSHAFFELWKLFYGVSPFISWLLSQCWLLTHGFSPTPCGPLHRLLEWCCNVVLTSPRESTQSFLSSWLPIVEEGLHTV